MGEYTPWKGGGIVKEIPGAASYASRPRPEKPVRRRFKPDSERRTVPFVLRLTAEEREVLEMIAQQQNVSMAWLVRYGIDKVVEEYTSKLKS